LDLFACRIVGDTRPLPPQAATEEEDEALFEDDPWVQPPIRIDYGYNVKVGSGAFINHNCTIIDTCTVTIGARTLFGPNVSLYSGTHPLDPLARNGTKGPELGKEIHIGEDVWIGGNAIILPGVRLGRGCVVGAGSVVTKDVPDFCVVAGNPARLLKKIETTMDLEHPSNKPVGGSYGAEEPMKDMARDLEVK
jgi:acetyltransferase-like isoleucine patch superfamily enzyme